MRRWGCLLLLLPLLALAGCGSLPSGREMGDMALLRTLGVDGAGEGLEVTASTGPRPRGLQASTRMPRSRQKARVSPCWQPGWNSIWFTMGATSVSSRAFRWWGRKLDTPMARIFPAW